MNTKKKTPQKAARKKAAKSPPAVPLEGLFDRVADIIEQARGNIVRAVNTNMVMAYWLIGREIVQEIQGGKERAAYGRQVLGELSRRLTERYGVGYSETTLQYFRKFYQIYADRCHQIPRPMGVELTRTGKVHPLGDELLPAFSPKLSWSHYRALMRVEKSEAREFYEQEAIAGGWDKRTLERQIQSSYYLLIDLKIGKLTHGDVGQMDGYVRMFDDLCVTEGDNPTIGLILCTEKDEVVAKYSVLNDRRQIFASKYMLYLPTEEELRLEIERERRLIEAHLADGKPG